MKITGVTRKNYNIVDLPVSFFVGIRVVKDGEPVESIIFYETGCFAGKGYRGPCYVISFKNSPIKTVIKAEDVVEITVDSEVAVKKSDKAGASPALASME